GGRAGDRSGRTRTIRLDPSHRASRHPEFARCVEHGVAISRDEAVSDWTIESPSNMSDWWKRGVIYQIYPLSFQDANGDGRGDLRGIQSRLYYLQWLGVDAVWISPIYPSPMKDCGYDIADYCDIAPEFGRLADFDALVVDAHRRNIRIILDFVPNHTSDQHPWFRQSRASRDNARRDWYIWRDPAPDGG